MPAPAPTPRPVEVSRGKILLAGALLVLAALVAYHATFAGPFIFDDKPAILENPTIRHLRPLTTVLSPPHDGSSVTGRPLVNLSLALNHALSGEHVWSYHALNLLIHILAGLTLFGIVRRTLAQPALLPRVQAAALPLGFTATALWLVHPLLTESVTSLIQRTESQMGLFFLLTLYCFIRGTGSKHHRWWFGLSVTACLLGMASKEVMATAPLIVLLYDRTFIAGAFREAWRRHRRVYLGLAATWLLLGWLVMHAGGTRGEAAGFGLGVTPWTYALTQCRAIALYLKLAVWPHPLVFDYGTGVAGDLSGVLPQALLLTLLFAGTAWALWRRPVVGFAGACFFIILAPSSSFVPLVSQTIAEHRMYLPLAALMTLIVTAAYVQVGRAALVAAIVVAVAFVTLTEHRNRTYGSELAIWTDTVAKAPANARARVNLAEVLILAGRPADALEQATEAVRLRPGYPEAQSNLGIALAQTGHPDDALPHAWEAVRLKPNYAKAQSNLGTVLILLDRPVEAIAHLEEALRLTPHSPDEASVRRNLGRAYFKAGRLPEAIAQYETALRLDPGSAETHYSLGLVLGLSGRYDEAATQFELVLKLKPDHIGARKALEALRAGP